MAIPSFDAFNQLPLSEQLAIVLHKGPYLAMRFGSKSDWTNLHYLGRFVAVVYYDSQLNH